MAFLILYAEKKISYPMAFERDTFIIAWFLKCCISQSRGICFVPVWSDTCTMKPLLNSIGYVEVKELYQNGEVALILKQNDLKLFILRQYSTNRTIEELEMEWIHFIHNYKSLLKINRTSCITSKYIVDPANQTAGVYGEIKSSLLYCSLSYL